MTQKNKFVFVLGPHRSGTSLVAGALSVMGVNLGKGFIAPNADNPKGFFEDEEIVQFNDRLLKSLSLSWDSFAFIWPEDFSSTKLQPYHNTAVRLTRERFSDCAIAGLKDPRFCILLPFWKRVIAEALDVDVSYVLVVREPNQSVRSQRVRHINDSDFHLLGRRNIHTLLLWWTYLSKALADVEPEQLLIVDYISLVKSPQLELRRLATVLESEPSQEVISHFCQGHLEPALNRSANMPAVDRTHGAELWAYADTLYQRLQVLSQRDSLARRDVEAALENLSFQKLEPLYLREIQYGYGYAKQKIGSLRHRLIRTIHEMGVERADESTLQAKYDALREEHERFINSRGWRLLNFVRRLTKWPSR